MRLCSDISRDVILGKMTGRSLRHATTPPPLPAAPSLAGALHVACSEGCPPPKVFGKKHQSTKCKQPIKCKCRICNAGALDLLNMLRKEIIGLGFFR